MEGFPIVKDELFPKELMCVRHVLDLTTTNLNNGAPIYWCILPSFWEIG